ncbi:hypothetical protein F5X71_34745 [Nocardia brasiliensis]|uniref:Uncharacterized protein n=1 Tax=Nocardia brasiliensis TaxID=37326 RepID=A0A6G9Y0Q3_NOCBR|nr:DUF6338 family protein [Nocardia brasiliensis]QIS06785.1 hypothetical protein F5X71_34745 [Nocardia brasiliensis]
MNLPQTVAQFFVLLLLVVPGITFIAVRRTLRGPGADDKDFSARLANAIAVSIAFACLYALCLGPWLIELWTKNAQGVPGYVRRPQLAALTAAGLAFAVPIGVAAICNLRVRRVAPNRWVRDLRVVRLPMGYAAPSAWDARASSRADCFIRIYTADSMWVGGYIPGNAGFIATHPQPRDIFIPEPWKMNANGEFVDPVENSIGLYVPLTGAERVEWVAEPEGEEAPRPPDQPADGASS